MSKLRPILFQPEMVRAIQAGIKTQTRRTIKPQPPADTDITIYKLATNVSGPADRDFNKHHWLGFDRTKPYKVNDGSQGYFTCPYGEVGDVLWVRETFRKYYDLETDTHTPIYDYAADRPEPLSLIDGDGFQVYNSKGEARYVPYKPSIHMPYEACRIWLKITNIRVERLQDISEQDAWAEGCKRGEPTENGGYFPADEPDKSGIGEIGWDCAKDWYTDLWESINGDESWEANPWVWVVEFELTEAPKP